MKITVFTPTFNRAYIIENLYHSLQHQTFLDFEWLVVDDGSLDHTEEVVQGWKTENNFFQIRYYKKENGGKCSAINMGLKLAQGELFFTVDSDDYLTDDALGKIASWEESLPKNQKFCGIAGNLGTAKGTTPNRIFNSPFLDGSALDRYKMVDGERAMVFYTEIHRQYPYPLFDDEKFMTEAVAWNRMAADGYKMRYFNDIICIYEYKEDGLTKAGKSVFLTNPKGYGLWLREKAIFQKLSFWKKLKMQYTFVCDLTGRYDTKFIAKCIGTSTFYALIINVIHKLIYCARNNEE